MNFWVDYYDVWITIISFKFCLAVSKSSWNWQTTRNDSYRSLSHWTIRSSQHDIIILICLTSRFDYSKTLWLFRWFMVIWNLRKNRTMMLWKYCTRISCVGYPNLIIDNKHYNSTRSTFVSNLNKILPHKNLLSFFKS